MANQITDNRTLVDSAEVVTNYVSSSGPSQDTEIKIQGTASIGDQFSNSLRYLSYRHPTAAQDWSNNTFYIWVNCGIVGLLDTKANGGFRVRFAGNTNTDYFEVYVGGSDSWPTSIEGGWTQFVVDIETARSTAVTNGWTNGTTPATTAIREVGVAGLTAGTMTRNVDNTWIDEIRRLPDGSPGIIVEGRNGGSTDWTSADIFTQLGTATGTFVPTAGGAYKINTPIQFGINDTTTHGFTDTNKIWLWDDQEYAPSDLYSISALGNSGGTTNVTFGTSSGSGDDATGSQGLTIAAASTGVRWAMDFDDPNLDAINLHGCSFIHGGDFQLDDAAVSVISSLYIDCTSATVTGSQQLRNSVINANTADGVGFMLTTDPSDIKYCTFQWSDGHAIEYSGTATASYTFTGNTFSGYGSTGTNDAAFYNTNTSGTLNLNVTNGASFTTRTGTGGTTNVNVTVGVTITVVDTAGDPIQAAQVYVQKTSPTAFTSGAGNSAGDADLVVTQTIDTDMPSSGFLSVLDRSLQSVQGYRYAAQDGANTFTFPSEVTGSATSTEDEYVDSYALSNNDTQQTLDNAATFAVGQSFTADGRHVDSVTVEMNKNAGSTGTVYCYIYAHSGTYGTSSVPTGSPLATATREVSTFSTSMQNETFTFNEPVDLVGGTNYFVSIEYPTATGSNYVGVNRDIAGGTHSGNSAINNGSWSAQSTVDMGFLLNTSSGLQRLTSTSTNFLTVDIEEGDTIRNTTDGSWAVVDEIISADVILTSKLQGGTDDTWESGDAFSVHRLATALVSGTDTVDAPLLSGQTDGSGEFTGNYKYSSNQAVSIRVRSNHGLTKYVPLVTSATITSTGLSVTITLQEDTVAT